MPSQSAAVPGRSRPDARPRRRRHKRHSGDVLLDAASALMIERNSITVTFSDIAARAQLNSALIHYRFGGKAGLFRALIERDVGGTFPHLDDLVTARAERGHEVWCVFIHFTVGEHTGRQP